MTWHLKELLFAVGSYFCQKLQAFWCSLCFCELDQFRRLLPSMRSTFIYKTYQNFPKIQFCMFYIPIQKWDLYSSKGQKYAFRCKNNATNINEAKSVPPSNHFRKWTCVASSVPQNCPRSCTARRATGRLSFFGVTWARRWCRWAAGRGGWGRSWWWDLVGCVWSAGSLRCWTPSEWPSVSCAAPSPSWWRLQTRGCERNGRMEMVLLLRSCGNKRNYSILRWWDKS